MKTEGKILIAFILNLLFSVFEFIGGIVTGSVAIISDAVHDMGDAVSIGVSYFLERKSKTPPDGRYTYGYVRYSAVGGLITTLILLAGSIVVIYNAVGRMIVPKEIDYNGMIIFALVGVAVNFCAAFFTRGGSSLNQKAVNLHMLEDVLGWAVVLVGAVVMRFTGFALIDPIMSIGVSIFILINAIANLKEIADLFLEKVPSSMEIAEVEECMSKIDGVTDTHHIHLWGMDGHNNFATMHVVTDMEAAKVKEEIREKLRDMGIGHVTIEIETVTEHCGEKHCRLNNTGPTENSHHHHHHHLH